VGAKRWDPEQYARHARFVSELGLPVVELLAPAVGERVLDLGCGDGALTERLAAAGCEVVGIDSSPEQVAAARARGLDARVGDARALEFDCGFDAVFSNAVLHWVREPRRAIDGAWRALRPGGRFVGELGGRGCVARIAEALAESLGRRGLDARALDPWYFPSDAEYGDLLRARGFQIDSLRLFERPTPLPGDLGAWLETFADSFLAPLDGAGRTAVIDEVRERLRPKLCDAQGRWTADYVRVRFAATRPALAPGEMVARGERAALRVQFVHGLEGSPRGAKAQLLAAHFDALTPAMDTRDFEGCVRAQTDALRAFRPQLLVGSSYGAAVVLELLGSGAWRGPTLLLAQAALRMGRRPQLPPGVPLWIVHGRADALIDVADSRALARMGRPQDVRLIEVDDDHSLAASVRAGALADWVRALAAWAGISRSRAAGGGAAADL
jgi:trans-aconitate methyltransferase